MALALLLVELLFGDTLVDFASDLLRGLDAVPAWMIALIVVGTRILAVVVLGGGLIWALVGRRWRMLVTVGLAVLLAELLVSLQESLVDHDEGRRLVDVDAVLGPLSSDGFPTVWGIAGVAAALTAAAPWLSRGWRRAGWALLVGMMVTDVLTSPVSFAWLGAGGVGWVCRRGRAGGVGSAVATADLAGRRRRPLQRRASTAAAEPGGRRRPRVDAVLRGR